VARSGGWKSRAGETDRQRRVVVPRQAVKGKVPGDVPRSTGGQQLAPSAWEGVRPPADWGRGGRGGRWAREGEGVESMAATGGELREARIQMLPT